jgi:glycosyltransferase involved in cell wall biosynthesis
MLQPDDAVFCLLSFEGPDPYAIAGGLGVRVTHLAETLARRGFETHLFFVGSPDEPGLEKRLGDRLILHRWCQWISRYHPAGVYDGEEGKLRDFTESLPPFLVETIVLPAVARNRLVVILAEEWHTVEAVIRLRERLREANLEGGCLLVWNANNTLSFDRVDWVRLAAAADLTTVSRYMKYLMWKVGVNPLVIPNGIPSELLATGDSERSRRLRAALDPGGDGILLFKVGRFDPAKRWLMAVEAAALLKEAGFRITFAFRGGIEAHGHEVMARAHDLGLSVTFVDGRPGGFDDMVALLEASPPADIYSLQFFMTPELLSPFYRTADAVLANSGHEPFGLVGLEAMASGGIVFTGITGEDYAIGGKSAVVLETDSPDEIVSAILELKASPDAANALRAAARQRAADYTWEHAADLLLGKLKYLALTSSNRSLRIY